MSNDWDRYERKGGIISSLSTGGKPRHPSPCVKWQAAVYEEEMSRKPPEPVSPQFDYNPRTKAGKALLEEMAHSR